MDPAGSVAMEILTPESVISGVRSSLDAFREGAENLTKTSLASIFRVGELCKAFQRLPAERQHYSFFVMHGLS